MFAAELICTDDDCAEPYEACGPVEELECLVCDCGCALAIVSVAQMSGAAAAVDCSPLARAAVPEPVLG